MSKLRAPFPYFGGKSTIAPIVWDRFGRVQNYVEPFFGSGAMLLSRPGGASGVETVNDMCGFIANFWRAIQADPDAVAKHADWPVNECDLHARHLWLVRQKDSMQSKLEGDPEWYDAKIAGWWCWGLCCWIGSGWCSGDGPWRSVDGVITKVDDGSAGEGVGRRRPHLGDAGQGVNRQLPHLGDAGRGANRLGRYDIFADFAALSKRLRRVRVCCGDWSRVCGPAPTLHQSGITAVFLDPPYSAEAERNMTLYRAESGTVAHDVRAWAIEQGTNPRMRIALCGYEGEHAMPDDWECVAWKAQGGYARLGDQRGLINATRERVWFSPHCHNDSKTPLFSDRGD